HLVKRNPGFLHPAQAKRYDRAGGAYRASSSAPADEGRDMRRVRPPQTPSPTARPEITLYETLARQLAAWGGSPPKEGGAPPPARGPARFRTAGRPARPPPAGPPRRCAAGADHPKPRSDGVGPGAAEAAPGGRKDHRPLPTGTVLRAVFVPDLAPEEP